MEAQQSLTEPNATVAAGRLAVVVMTAMVLALATYWPCLDNGFISDDFVILERVDHSEWSLTPFGPAHETFRATSYGVFRLLKHLVGSSPPWFYLFAISLHAVNASLLFLLLLRLRVGETEAALAAVLFLTVQNAQEAVMWLAAMNELLLACFGLLLLLFWTGRRYAAAGLALLAALFSKESGLALAILVPCFEAWRTGRPQWHRRYVFLLAPCMVFAGVFLITLRHNTLASSGGYGLNPFHAAGVLFLSVHRLLFPWAYILLAVSACAGRPVLRVVIPALGGLTLVMAPYLFLSYMEHLPSRQLYLATMILAVALARLLSRLESKRLAAAYVALFVAGNVGYIALRKDAQFEARAAPTTRLIQFMQTHAPRSLALEEFPYNPWVAKLTTRLCPGWEPSLVHITKDSAPDGPPTTHP